MTRDVSIVGRTRSAISVLTERPRPPRSPARRRGSRARRSGPPCRRAGSAARARPLIRWLSSTTSLNASEIFPSMPGRPSSSRTVKSPRFNRVRTARSWWRSIPPGESATSGARAGRRRARPLEEGCCDSLITGLLTGRGHVGWLQGRQRPARAKSSPTRRARTSSEWLKSLKGHGLTGAGGCNTRAPVEERGRPDGAAMRRPDGRSAPGQIAPTRVAVSGDPRSSDGTSGTRKSRNRRRPAAGAPSGPAGRAHRGTRDKPEGLPPGEGCRPSSLARPAGMPLSTASH